MSTKTSKNILFYGIKYFPSRGGTSRVAENIIKNLIPDFSISIYCYKHPKAKSNVPGVKVRQFPELPFGGLGVLVYYFITALHILVFVNRKTIIHAHKTDCALFLPLLRLKFKKIIATSHEAPYHRDKWNYIGKKYFHFVEWVFMHSGATLTSISKPLADYYSMKYNKTVQFIPNGIDMEQTIEQSIADDLLKKNQVAGSYLMYSARRIMSTKGLHTMLEAVNLLGSDMPVLIAGDVSHAKNYVERLNEKYRHLNLIYLGYIDLPVLLGLLKKAALFVFPSEIEGMSIMLLEVISVGIPIVCSDIPENTQVFNTEEVLFFKNKDAQDLKEKMGYALAHPEEMSAFTKKAQLKIKTELSWRMVSEKYKTLLEAL